MKIERKEHYITHIEKNLGPKIELQINDSRFGKTNDETRGESLGGWDLFEKK